jgi:hypothetical protein
VLPETAEETLPEVDRICLTMEKTKDLKSLIETDEREGAESDSLAAATTEGLPSLGRVLE